MNHFPVITAKELIRALKSVGFYEHHQKGSHKIFKRDADKKRVVVPFHAGRNIPRKTLKAILLDAEIALERIKDLI